MRVTSHVLIVEGPIKAWIIRADSVFAVVEFESAECIAEVNEWLAASEAAIIEGGWPH